MGADQSKQLENTLFIEINLCSDPSIDEIALSNYRDKLNGDIQPTTIQGGYSSMKLLKLVIDLSSPFIPAGGILTTLFNFAMEGQNENIDLQTVLSEMKVVIRDANIAQTNLEQKAILENIRLNITNYSTQRTYMARLRSDIKDAQKSACTLYETAIRSLGKDNIQMWINAANLHLIILIILVQDDEDPISRTTLLNFFKYYSTQAESIKRKVDCAIEVKVVTVEIPQLNPPDLSYQFLHNTYHSLPPHMKSSYGQQWAYIQMSQPLTQMYREFYDVSIDHKAEDIKIILRLYGKDLPKNGRELRFQSLTETILSKCRQEFMSQSCLQYAYENWNRVASVK